MLVWIVKVTKLVVKYGPLVRVIWEALKQDVEIPDKYRNIVEVLREGLTVARDLIDTLLTKLLPPPLMGACGCPCDDKEELKAFLESEAGKPDVFHTDEKTDELLNYFDDIEDCCVEDSV